MKFLLGLSLFFLFACSSDKKPKNIILIIGDGFGPQQLSLLESYAKFSKNSSYKASSSHLVKLVSKYKAGMGLSFTNPLKALVVDSAASATHLATGKLTYPQMVGVDLEGKDLETVLEKAKSLGKKTALITDTRVGHATPAAFAAHVPHRSMENTIVEQMMEVAPDILLGGGLRHFLPKDFESSEKFSEYQALFPVGLRLKGKRKDGLVLLDKAKEKKYELVFSKDQLKNAKTDRLLGLFSTSGMPNMLEMTSNKLDAQRIPTLLEMTQMSLEKLSHSPKGFFMMVESGQIDWAAHANDAGMMLAQLLHFDQVIEYIVEWAQKNEDTLVVLVGDHETGSFGLSYHFGSDFAADLPSEKNPALSSEGEGGVIDFGQLSILDRLKLQTSSLEDISKTFLNYPLEDRTGAKLCEIHNQYNSGFELSLDECNIILSTWTTFSKQGNTFKKLFDDYYYEFSSNYNRLPGLMARSLAGRQNIVWGTGTHTSTPIPVYSWGSRFYQNKLSGFTSHDKIGQVLLEAIE